MRQPVAGLTYQGKPRTHGFRLSWMDAVVTVLGVVASALAYISIGDAGLFIPFVVAHFFLFCNVFRIRRSPEIAWAVIFLLNCGLWVFFGVVSVYGICASQLPVTLCILAIEIRKPHYHGVFARHLNPRLADYLNGRL